MADDFREVADFVTIYTEEAHPVSGWFIPTHLFRIDSHRGNLTARLQAAACLASTFEINSESAMRITVDAMDNNAMLAYGATPDRLYILRGDMCVYAGAPGPYGYDLSEVERWLQTNTSME